MIFRKHNIFHNTFFIYFKPSKLNISRVHCWLLLIIYLQMVCQTDAMNLWSFEKHNIFHNTFFYFKPSKLNISRVPSSGERLSPWVAFGCFAMGMSTIFFWGTEQPSPRLSRLLSYIGRIIYVAYWFIS
jgi:hypothetical protein